MGNVEQTLDIAEANGRALVVPPAGRRFSRSAIPVVLVLSAWALICVVLSALYAQVYSLPFRLPDLEIEASVLAQVFGRLVPTLGGLAVGVILAGHYSTVRAWREQWQRVYDHAGRFRFLVRICAIVGSAVYAFVRITHNAQAPGAELTALTAGDGALPFQYRALVPWLVQVGGGLGVYDPSDAGDLAWVYGGIEFVVTLGALGAFAAMLRSFGFGQEPSKVLALVLFYPLYFTLAAGYRYANVFFPWDMVSVALFTVGLTLLLQRRWWTYYFVFVLATLNRETSCFLAVAYLFLALGKERPSLIARHVLAQLILWLCIKGGLSLLFVGNEDIATKGNGLYWSTHLTNLHALSMVPGWVYLAQAMGGIWIVVLMMWRWIGESRLQRLLLVSFPFVLGMFFVGVLLEVRVFSELIPLFTGAFLLIIRNGIRDARGLALEGT